LGERKNQDYPLWFWPASRCFTAEISTPADPKAYFEFIYPPPPAVLLAIPAYFGKLTLYICLSVVNVVAWWMTAQFSNAMAGSGADAESVAVRAAGFCDGHLRVRTCSISASLTSCCWR